ncbi:MAG: ABC transporter ATP-binding protein [Phycisphaerales bacterium JB039]
MIARPDSSRRRYADYRQRMRERGRADPEPDAPESPQKRRRTRSFFTLFAAFWGVLAGHRHMVALSLITLSVATGLGLLSPLVTKVAFDYVLTNTPGPAGLPEQAQKLLGLTDVAAMSPQAIIDLKLRLLWLCGGALVAIALGSIGFGMWGRWQTTRITKRLQASLRRRVFEHAVRLPLTRIYEIKSGGVASILREDAGGGAELTFSMIYNPWRAIITLIGGLVAMAIVDWRMLLGAIALFPLIWMTHKAWIGRIRPVFRAIRRTRTGIDAHATEAFGGMRIVRGFAREQGEAGRFIKGAHFMARQEILAWWWSRGVEIAWQILIPGASAAVLVYGGARVVRGDMTIGDVVMFSAYLLMLLGPLESLASSATNMQNQLAGFDRVLDLLEEKREFVGNGDAKRVERADVAGAITLDHLWFAYPRTQMTPDGRWIPRRNREEDDRGPDVLKDICLEVAPGETIALVGPSGAGKTTLINLVARFYDPVRGSVQLDGTDLREIDVRDYRALLGIVEQDVFLFDGTVGENIAYARRGAAEDEIIAAARAAEAHGFITGFDKGYGTLIGERGVRLSGGQKQRIAIARAILADPRILLLDEATSNLDSESERAIQKSLRQLMQGRTTFVIAHRLSTIRHADRIVVLEGGQIVESGPHDELAARSGRYAQLLRLQVEDLTAGGEPIDQAISRG